MYEEIIELINKGEINKAQEQIGKISDDDPKKYNFKALIHFNKKELEKAKEQFEKGLTINPVDSDLLFNYGYLLKEMNQEMEAWRYLMRIHDKDWATYDLLGDIEFKNRSKLASLRFYLKAAELTDNPQMKKKFLEIRNQIKKDTKIAFLCLPGLDNFLKDIVETFSLGYDVKLVVSKDANEITQAIKWADIVWLEWANDLAVFATNKVPEIENKKVICRLHGYEAFNVNVLNKINWDLIDRMIFVADHVREDAYESCPQVKNVPYTMVYNGINLDKFVFSKRTKGKRICFSGHVNYKKNPMLIIQILDKLLKIDDGYRIDWVGDHQDIRIKKYLNYILKDMGIEDKFTFHDWTNDINSWLENKNYFLSTSIHEGYGVGIMEAMARGIKPIIHNFYAARGFYPDEFIYNTIDEAVEKIIEESYDSESYRRFIEDNYSLERQIYEIEEILNTNDKDRVKGQTILLNAKEKDINPNVINANVSKRNLRDEEKYKNQFGKIWAKYSQIDSFQLMNESGNKTLRSEFIRLLNSYFLLRNAKILEVGTGTGNFSIEIAMREAKVTGIDIEESSIRLAKRISQDFEITDNIEFLLGDGFNLKKEGFKNFDIVFNMGVLEHFEDKQLVKMLEEMGQAGKFVVVGVPWSGSQIYKLSKQFSIANGTWEYGFERDFYTLREQFKRAGLYLLNESVIGGIVEVYYYLKRINPNAVKTALAIYFEKFFRGEQTGSWLVAIGTRDKKYAELFSNLKNNKRIFFKDNAIQIMDKKQSPISVVIPVYNGEKFVKNCFENVLEIDYENYEVVFVNDGSTDNTLGILKELIKKHQHTFSKIKIINLSENKGIYTARAEGLQNSSGDFIFFHNIDDKIYTNSLKYLNEDYQNFKSTNPLLTISCTLMQNDEFLGEVLYSLLWKSKQQIFAEEFNHLHGSMSIINTLFKRQDLGNAYIELMKILTTIGVKRMSVAEDSILSDYLLVNNYINKTIPVFYSFQGYEYNNPLSSSKQILKRLSDIPIHTAYLYYVLKKYFDENTLIKLEEQMLMNAQRIYGREYGRAFIGNYLKYKNLYGKFIFKD
ncbi:glycosyltransferase [Petrotoga sp. 9T1HF07.CasAA.8.2]|uniref:glycosyltransferase n=1 Tax=Petrotoga sp. 9T1HF07.CasAA.8.2 TaxID=1434329 RepID=UPI000EFBDBC5|nr:glycosyltransferase [Petrotoga sp. 9T1HF07.CasAA.8.2]